MTEIKIVFQEKFKQNVIMKLKNTTTAAELINKYFKQSCASKNDKMTKRFEFNGTEISANSGSTLKELGMKDMSSIKVTKDEAMAGAGSHKPPAPKYEPPQYEPPQEEPPQEEPPQEEPPQEEAPQEEAPQEEYHEDQPQEEAPQEEYHEEEQQEGGECS